jgi:hypothetical protein
MIDPHHALGAVILGGEDVGPASALWSGGIDAAAFKDAENECTHGRLSGDRTPPCGCWYDEPAPTPEPERQEEPVSDTTTAAPKKRGRPKKQAPALTKKEAGELLPKVVRDIDAEIVRLQSARIALIESVRNG